MKALTRAQSWGVLRYYYKYHYQSGSAFAYGMTIHSNDYDDTQLAVGKYRVYGLLIHPAMSYRLTFLLKAGLQRMLIWKSPGGFPRLERWRFDEAS